VNFKEIANRFTGFSTQISGVSWNPPKPDSEAAQRLITEIEDRRVLFNPSMYPQQNEIAEQCHVTVPEFRSAQV